MNQKADKEKGELLLGIHDLLCETCMNLYQDGDQKLAAQLEDLKTAIEIVMEDLRQRSLEDWIKQSQDFMTKVQPLISAVEADLKEINVNLKNSKKIASKVGSIDKALKSVVKYLA